MSAIREDLLDHSVGVGKSSGPMNVQSAAGIVMFENDDSGRMRATEQAVDEAKDNRKRRSP